jgi:hypothetical protein
MKKYLILMLTLTLTFAWVWAGEEDVKDLGYTASSEQQEAKWQPEYGPKGDLLNPEPGVTLARTSTPGGELDPPVIATTLLSEDFEDADWGDPDNPPPGWTILDNGNEGQQMWYNQDWHKYYYSASGFADTVARVAYTPSMEEEYDEWLITPDVALPGGATACSLTFKTYYDDGGTSANYDTAFVKISTDGGSNWSIIAQYDANQGTSSSPFLANYDVTSYAGQSVRFAFHLMTFGYVGYLGIDYWYMDQVGVWADAASLLYEDFNGWGPLGDNPPTGWSIIDNGTQIAGQGAWNVNDYHDYTRWSSKSARIYYTSSYEEWQDEWMISPSFAINAAAAYCTLSVVEYYLHSTSGSPWQYYDHGYIKITTDGGSNWSVI